LFYSPYEAAVWSIISARRARSQGIMLRNRLSELHGADFELSGIRTLCIPTPSGLLEMESMPGLPADRIPRLHAVAEAAERADWTRRAYGQWLPRMPKPSCSSCPASARSTAR